MIKSASQSSLTNDVKYRNLDTFNVPSSEYLIETSVLGSDAASVTFSNLGQYAGVYQHLQLRVTARTNRTGADSDPVILRFNGDTGNNYAVHGLIGYNFSSTTAIASNSGTSIGSIYLTEAMPVASSTATAFGAIVVDILDPFETTKNKVVRSLAGMKDVWSSVDMRSGLWMNTAGVTSITISPLLGTQLVTGSRFSLYGVTA
jgi:hypothetical protein